MNRFRRFVTGVVVALLALAAQVIAQQSSRSIVIHAGRMLDVKTGKLLSDQALVIEDAVGFVVAYRVLGKGVLDQDVVVPVMRELQERFGGKIKSASFDRSFHTPKNQQDLAELVRTPCIASKGQEKGRQQQEEGTVAFRQARQRHSGIESAIGALQAGNGLKRCLDRSEPGYERYVAWVSWGAIYRPWASCCWPKTKRIARLPSPNASARSVSKRQGDEK